MQPHSLPMMMSNILAQNMDFTSNLLFQLLFLYVMVVVSTILQKSLLT